MNGMTEEDYTVIYKNFIELLKNNISMVSVNTWFKDLKIHKIETVNTSPPKKNVIFETPSSFIKESLIKRYSDTIEEIMEKILGQTCEIEIALTDEIKEKKEEQVIIEENKSEEEVKNIIIQNDIPPNFTDFDSNLVEKYTFDNFVIGETNRLAQTAAMTVAENPGKIYNPFFIHGKSGLGKTHLMHAIGNYIKEHSNKKVLYVTSEKFIMDFSEIKLRKDSDYNQKFKDKYRNIDVLMIDDIQFLESAEKTQQEFFHTFNSLYDVNKQIIISSDRSPDDLKLLEERLRTRFSWGLTVNIYPPDIELKKRLIRSKMAYHETAKMVDEEVIDYIAANCENDVRHIEGIVTRLYAYAAMMVPKKIDLEFASEALSDYLKVSVYIDSNIGKIQKAVADYYNIKVEDLKSKKRNAGINYPRQIAIYLCREYTQESFPKIGLEFGNRDHSTIIHACDKISKDLKENRELREIIKEIKDNIG